MSVDVLIAYPQKDKCESLCAQLNLSGFQTSFSLTGKDVQKQVYHHKYFAIILDWSLQDHTALEVLRYLRLNAASSRIILTMDSEQQILELGISKKDLRNLGIHEILVFPYSAAEIQKLLEGKSSCSYWKGLAVSQNEAQEEEVLIPDYEFTRTRIGDFYSQNATIFDLYVRLSEDKYLKILNRGDLFEKKRLDHYQNEKNVEYLYFRTEDRAMYINFVNDLLKKLVQLESVSSNTKLTVAKNLTEKYIEEVYTIGLKPQLVDEGKNICDNMCTLIERDAKLSKILREYHDYDPPAFTHIFLVSFFSVLICKNLGWKKGSTLETMGLGSFFHDLGKLRLSATLRGLSLDQMSAEELLKYKMHPQYGVEMISGTLLNTEPIKLIIGQHHELINGEGFPKGLTGVKIYPLAKIASFADMLSNEAVSKRATPLDAFKTFLCDEKRLPLYDSLTIKAFGKALIDEEFN